MFLGYVRSSLRRNFTMFTVEQNDVRWPWNITEQESQVDLSKCCSVPDGLALITYNLVPCYS